MKKKLTLPVFAAIAALAITLSLSAFNTDAKPKADVEGKVLYAPSYFHFIGTPGQEEDETKWELITQTQYEDTYEDCNLQNDGCRLRTDSIQTLSSVTRPKLVEVNISGAHRNPKTSMLSGVTQVGNQNP